MSPRDSSKRLFRFGRSIRSRQGRNSLPSRPDSDGRIEELGPARLSLVSAAPPTPIGSAHGGWRHGSMFWRNGSALVAITLAAALFVPGTLQAGRGGGG